ncbi:hypothetical protein ACJX0J_012168, partial [Zea mays]
PFLHRRAFRYQLFPAQNFGFLEPCFIPTATNLPQQEGQSKLFKYSDQQMHILATGSLRTYIRFEDHTNIVVFIHQMHNIFFTSNVWFANYPITFFFTSNVWSANYPITFHQDF